MEDIGVKKLGELIDEVGDKIPKLISSVLEGYARKP